MDGIANEHTTTRKFLCLICGREIDFIETAKLEDLKTTYETSIRHAPPTKLACAWLLEQLVSEQQAVVRQTLARISQNLHIL